MAIPATFQSTSQTVAFAKSPCFVAVFIQVYLRSQSDGIVLNLNISFDRIVIVLRCTQELDNMFVFTPPKQPCIGTFDIKGQESYDRNSPMIKNCV